MKNPPKIYIFLIITSLFCTCYGEFTFNDSDYTKIFGRLSEVNDRWLQTMSFPEAVPLLKRPPYKHYSDLSLDLLNVSDSSHSDDNHTSKCSDDLVQVITNLGSEWALAMIDSDGKLASGVMRGGLIWPGHYDECNSVYSPVDDEGQGGFHGKYCTASWTLDAGGSYSKLPLTTGLCVPDSCHGKNLKNIIKNALHILGRFPKLKMLSSRLSLNDITCKVQSRVIDPPSIVFVTFLCVILLLVIVGSLMTVFEFWTEKKMRQKKTALRNRSSDASCDISQSLTESLSSKGACAPSANYGTVKDATPPTSIQADIQYAELHPRKFESRVKRFFLCFSVFKNGEKILNTDSSEGQLLSIHGIRFLSLVWVILGHTYITPITIIGNRLDVLKEIDSFSFQMLLQTPLSVDSFFLLSGFLLAYIFLKNISANGGKMNWLYFYIHRFWRLTPAYMIAVLFYMLLYKYIGSGPFWDDTHCDAERHTWWWYLLYINNFIPIHKMCVGWSWYLANDMQFYLISPFILYPLFRWPKVGLGILTSLLLGTWVITGVLSYKYDLIPMFVGVSQTNDFAAYAERMWNSFDMIYDKPYCRIAPYLIGILTGYALFKLQQRKNFLSTWQLVVGWTVSTLCTVSVLFGLYHVDLSKVTGAFYISLSRSAFSLSLAWVIFACETGHGGWVTKMLSCKLWIPLSRLTYCAYLVHPILIHAYFDSYPTALFFTEFVIVTTFMGFLIMSYGLAFLYSLAFESPMMNLEKLVLQKRS